MIIEALRTRSSNYKRDDIKGQLIEGKYYQQELLKSRFHFETNSKAFKSFNINNDNI